MSCWAGVDVGGRRKGFHLAVVDVEGLSAGPTTLRTVAESVEWLREREVDVVAVDSPIAPAPDGFSSRGEERDLARSVCGIRYTPDRRALAANPRYYEWIEHGFELYAALADAKILAIECFPTASWTRWLGERNGRSRARWSSQALFASPLRGLGGRLNQDERDAVGAALTARAFAEGAVEYFGPIVVPTPFV